jgi:arabinose-5-phosphate isomerase
MMSKNPNVLLRDVLNQLGNSIHHAAQFLNERDVASALREIFAASKICFIGVGKSGDIARKMASTFSSTGQPAYFIHAAEAFHGSLGALTPGEVAVLVSQSGETQEIVDLLPHIKARGIPTIGLICNAESTLAKKVDVFLWCKVDKEACPLNLAPTTSTLVTMAVGDALAILLMKERGFTAEDFARNHPSGQLGKRLTLRVKDLMITPAPVVEADAGVFEVMASITRGSCGATLVRVAKGEYRIVSDGDLRRHFEKNPNPEGFKIKAVELGTAKPKRIGEDVLAKDSLAVMQEEGRLVTVLVVENGVKEPVGFLRMHDVIKAGL